ncbi:MAG TPA: PAS domain S-box protein [Rariglobus sp.]|nr:PAS domain S-box protein [Rariglobus sp.]
MKRLIPLISIGFGSSLLTLTAFGAQFAPAAGGASGDNSWLRWMGAVFVVIAAGGLLVFWINVRLQAQVSAQTRALRVSEARMRNLFENTPVAIVEEDFSAVVRWLDELRRQGVEDLRAHLAAHAGLVAEKYPLVRVVAANRPVLKVTGAKDVADYARLMVEMRTPAVLDAFEAELHALWENSTEMTRELRYRGVDGRPGHSLMHWSVPDEGGRPDYTRVQVAFTDLGVLRATEEKLRNIEDRWRLAVISVNAGIWEYNFVTGETFLSDRWKEIIGYSASDLPNVRGEFWGRVHPDDAERVRKSMNDYLAGQSSGYAVEFRMRCKDGHYKWILSRGHALFNDVGEPQRLVGAHSDIDKRKRSEEALRASEERYRVLFENSPVAILEYDLRGLRTWLLEARKSGVGDFDEYVKSRPGLFDGLLEGATLVGLNRETLTLVGAKTREEVMEAAPRIVTMDMGRVRRALCRAIWEGRNAIEGEVVIHALDGTPRRVFYRWWVPSLSGEPSFAWTQVVLVDLTGIKQTEEALAAERERLSVTLRAMAEGVITTDTQGRVLFFNEAAAQLTGWSEEAAIGRAINEVCVLRHEKTGQSVSTPAVEAVSSHGVIELPASTVLMDRQGVPRLVEGRCAPIHDPQSQAIGAVLVLRDVTERARLEGEILRASKLESVGILAGGIAHDFNNLLTVVMGNLTLAMLDSQVMTAAGRWLQDAERGVLRARDLTQQLLTFARGGEPVRSAVRLPEVVREAANFALHGSKVRCDFAIDVDLWTAEVDKGQIGQVVQNLVINAMQAMPDGGVMHITMRNERLQASTKQPLADGAYLCVEIRDTGTGISAEHITRIFDPYFTTKKSGSGLGLATVYSIIRKHQGHIEVESELGHGTLFRFWLPAAPDVRPATSEPAVHHDNLTGRVLFMDDEEPIRAIAQSLFKRLGFEVTTVCDGHEAVRVYSESRQSGTPFDLVIMDLTVPGGMGGKAAMVELLKIDPGVKGIVSSGYSSDPVMANYRAHGFSGMVAKPYKLTDLAKTIRSVMEGGDSGAEG